MFGKQLFCSVLLSLSFYSSSAKSIEASWKQVSNSQGIEVFQGEVKDSPVVAFKGIAVIDSSIQKVASVLYNMDRKKEWMHNLEESRLVRYTGPFERIEYNHTRTPWPLSHRDFIFKAKVDLNPEKNLLKLNIVSVDDPSIPENKGIVRGELKESVYVLEALEDGKTRISVEILADPKGAIPKFLVNAFQRAWPSNTIKGIQKEVARADFQVDERVKKFFETSEKAAEVKTK